MVCAMSKQFGYGLVDEVFIGLNHHHHHISFMELGDLLTRSGLT